MLQTGEKMGRGKGAGKKGGGCDNTEVGGVNSSCPLLSREVETSSCKIHTSATFMEYVNGVTQKMTS